MSFQAMAWATAQSPGGTKEKFVLIMLSNYASSETGKCFPSINTLSDQTMMSRNTVIRALKSLEDLGFIRVEKRVQEGVNLPNIYHLNMGGVVPHRDGGSATQALGVVPHRDPNLSSEPIIKPIERKARVGSETKEEFRNELSTILSQETIENIIKVREKKRSPVNAFTGRLLASALKKCPNVTLAAEEMILRGWTSVKPEWLSNDRTKSPSIPDPQHVDWSRRMEVWNSSATWSHSWGPKPGEAGCKAPQ